MFRSGCIHLGSRVLTCASRSSCGHPLTTRPNFSGRTLVFSASRLRLLLLPFRLQNLGLAAISARHREKASGYLLIRNPLRRGLRFRRLLSKIFDRLDHPLAPLASMRMSWHHNTTDGTTNPQPRDDPSDDILGQYLQAPLPRCRDATFISSRPDPFVRNLRTPADVRCSNSWTSILSRTLAPPKHGDSVKTC